MNAALDHAVVVVDSLGGASEAFRAAGFTVTAGGRHDALPTENALVVFADGAYLELLAARDAATRASLRKLRATDRWARHLHESSAVARRFLPGLAGPVGVTDFALRAERLERFAAESRRRGHVLTGPVAFGRERPGAARIDLRLLFPAEPWLPFLVEDRTPLAARVPGDPAARTHPNGAAGIAGVTVRVPDVAAAAMAYADRFEATLAPLEGGAAAVRFGGNHVTLVEGGPPGACGVAIAGAQELPPALAALGLAPGRRSAR